MFRRASTRTFDEAWIDDSRERWLERFDYKRAAPIVAIVVDVLEKAIAFFRKRGQLEFALVDDIAVKFRIVRRRLPIKNAADFEVMQMTVEPAHGSLKGVVQGLEREIGRDLDAPPDGGIDVEERNVKAGDKVLHAALQFQGKSSSIRLAG